MVRQDSARPTFGETTPNELQQHTSHSQHAAPRPPPLRPGSKEFVSGLKRLSSQASPDKRILKKRKTDALTHTTYRENYQNFLNFLTKEMDINYKMKRGRG